MAQTRGLSFSSKKDFANRRDFGLGQFRLALPQNNPRYGIATQLKATESKRESKGFGKKFKDLLSRSSPSDGAKQQPVVRPKPSARIRNSEDTKKHSSNDDGISDTINESSPGLHSRVLQKEHMGIKSSFESLLDEYGLKKDGTPKLNRQVHINKSDPIIRLTVSSPEADNKADHQITLRKSSKGLGIHLSVGPPPVYVTLIEPGSEAMAAGLKNGDIILEVNGSNCRSMEALELSELMELKSLIQDIPNTSGVESAPKENKPRSLTVTSIDSDVDDAEESDEEELGSYNDSDSNDSRLSTDSDEQRDLNEDDESEFDNGDDDDIQLHGNGKKQKVTKGVWNRIKAEGLIDSDSNDSFDMELTEIYNKDILASTEKNPKGSSSSSKIEINEKDWKKLKQKQSLIFNTNAPSNVISDSKKHNPNTDEQSQTPSMETQKRTLFKWPFKMALKSSSVKNKDENGPVKADTSQNEVDSVTVPAMKEKKRTPPLQMKKSVRPKSLLVHNKSKNDEKETLDITAVLRTTPLLGIDIGHERRNIGKTRNVRKPTRRQLSGESHGFDDTLPVEPKNDAPQKNEIVTNDSKPLEQVPMSDHHDSNDAQHVQNSLTHSYSSAGLVELALKKRRSITQLETMQNRPKTANESSQRTRTNTIGTSYDIGLTAQMVANAAANKAQMINQESITDGRSESNDLLKRRWSEHASKKKKTISHEPSWVLLAKQKQEKLAQEYSKPTAESSQDNNELSQRVVTYQEFINTRFSVESSHVNEHKSCNKAPQLSSASKLGLVHDKKAIFESKID